mgnify:CR=1 FL=1
MVQSYWKFLQSIADNTDYEALAKRIAGRDVYIRGADQRGSFYKCILENNGILVKGFIDLYKEGDFIYRPDRVIFPGNSLNTFIFIAMQFAHRNELEQELESAGFLESDYYWPYKEWHFMNQKIGNRTNCSHQDIYFRGAELYFKLNPSKLYFFVYGGHNGDAGMVMSWLHAFKKKHLVRTISIITTSIHKSICELYDQADEIIVYPNEEARSLDYFVRDMTTRVYNIFGSEWLWVDKSLKLPFDMNHILYKIYTLGLDSNTPSEYFHADKITRNMQERFDDAGLVCGQSVILIPYARSAPNLPTTFWECLANKLKTLFSVYTNCAGDDVPIRNTMALRLSIGDIPFAVRYAGASISIRCGIADILALGQCEETLVLYYVPNEVEMNYAKVNRCYINGEGSILYRNSVFIDQTYDENRLTDEIVEKIGIILKNHDEIK